MCVEGPSTAQSLYGTYIQSTDNGYWRLENGRWQAVTDTNIVSELQDLTTRPLAYERRDLRIRPAIAPSDIPLVLEQRNVAAGWMAVPWINERFSLDNWCDIAWRDGTYWVVTPTGVVPFDMMTTREPRLDPNNASVVRNGIPFDDQTCLGRDMTIVEDDMVVRLNEQSTELYRTQFNGSALQNSFHSVAPTEDIFAEVSLVTTEDTALWEWKLTGRVNNQPGTLKGTFFPIREGGEPLELSDGQFSFDTLTSLASIDAAQIQIATERAGWYQVPLSTFRVADMSRNVQWSDVDATTVNHIVVSLFDPLQHQAALCVQTRQGASLVLAVDTESNTQAIEPRENPCVTWIGSDGFWNYETGSTEVVITSPSAEGGTGVRLLEEGRFTDDIVMGLPVLLRGC